MASNDLISRAAVLDIITKIGITIGVTGEPVSLVAAKAQICALPAASQPEAEPVAWQRRLKFPDAAGAVPQWQRCPAAEATGHFEKSPHHEYRPLYAHAAPAPVVPAEGLDAEHLVAAWLDEMEAFATRRERLMDDVLAECDLAPWLHAACQVGIDAALRAQQPAAPVSWVTVQEGTPNDR